MRDNIYSTKKHIYTNRKRRFSALGGIVCFLFCVCSCMMAGCGKQDEVFVIPVEESAVENNGSSAENTIESIMQGSGENGTEDSEISDASAPAAGGTICVYVCGAVVNPGMVELPGDSRVADALQACGGFGENARRDVINLAEKVADGDMVRFPSLDEEIPWAEADSGEKDGKININTADVSQLITLSGIGESRARDIITYRDSNGDFAKTEDIKKVPGIKESIYSKICDKITVK